MIESNLEMTHSCVFFLFISGGFDNIKQTLNTVARVALLFIFVVWPIFLTIFIWFNMENLTAKKFKRKFISIYQGIKIKKFSTSIYTAVFCIRRFFLVITFLLLHEK